MPPRFSLRALAQWPWIVVRVDCGLCKRRGCYRLARLAAKYKPEQSIDGLLRDLAHNYPWYNERPRKYEPRCGARFPDFERNFPPADHPDQEPKLYRQRQPAREDLPKLKPPEDGGLLLSSPMLSAWSGADVGHQCRGCPRRAMFAKAGLLHMHGDVSLAVLLDVLTADCPRRRSAQSLELCGATIIRPLADYVL